jgi:hypothetical protein
LCKKCVQKDPFSTPFGVPRERSTLIRSLRRTPLWKSG